MKSEAVLQRAAQVCADRGGKLTTKRRQVLAGLLASDKALSAYDLADKCKEAFGVTLFPMSIYRILEFLETVGLVHRLKTTNKFIACAHIACDHAHDTPQFLICRECNRVEEVGIALQQHRETNNVSWTTRSILNRPLGPVFVALPSDTLIN